MKEIMWFRLLILFPFSGWLCLGQALAQEQIKELEQSILSADGIQKAKLHNQLAQIYLNDSPSKAITESYQSLEEFDQWLEQNDDSFANKERAVQADAYIIRGEARLKLGEQEGAKDDFIKALEISQLYGYDEGVLIAKESLKEWGEEIVNKKLLGDIAKWGKNIGVTFQKLIEENSSFEINNLNETIAKELERKGNYSKALQYYWKAYNHYEERGKTLKQQEIQTLIAELENIMGNANVAMEFVDADIEEITKNVDSIYASVITNQIETSSSIATTEKNAKQVNKERETELNLISPSRASLSYSTTDASPTKASPNTLSAKRSTYVGAENRKRTFDALKNKLEEVELRRYYDSIEAANKIAFKAKQVMALQNEQYEQDAMLLEKQRLLDRQQYMRNILLFSLAFFVGIIILLSILYVSRKRSLKKLSQAYDDLESSHRELKTAQIKLVESEKMASLGQLTAGIAHEINNPVNFISGNIVPLRRDVDDLCELINTYEQIIKEKKLEPHFEEAYLLRQELELNYLTEEIQALLAGIDEGASRTTEIVKGLRTFARVDEETSKPFDVHLGLESTLTLLQNKSQHIHISKDYGQMDLIEGYPGKINQVFMNVLNNAIQALDEKYEDDANFQGEIHIKTFMQNGVAFINIRDNGPGIPEEAKNRIFEPFYTTKDIGVGTGLGLSICLGIIEKHEGKIEVTSKHDEFTEISIQLPTTLTPLTKTKAIT